MNNTVPQPQPAQANPPRLPPRGEIGTPPIGLQINHNINRASAQPPTPGPANETNINHHAKKRANINIATLNLNGASASTANLNAVDKWARINSTLRNNKIAVLALQETHLDEGIVEVSAARNRMSEHPSERRGLAYPREQFIL